MASAVGRGLGYGLLLVALSAGLIWTTRQRDRVPSQVRLQGFVALWEQPYDAARTDKQQPWPVHPKRLLEPGTRLVVLASQRTAKKWLLRVSMADGQTGWIDAREPGVVIIP